MRSQLLKVLQELEELSRLVPPDMELWQLYCACCRNFASMMTLSAHERLYCTRLSDAVAAHLTGNSALLEVSRTPFGVHKSRPEGVERALLESLASQTTLSTCDATLRCSVFLRRDIATAVHRTWHQLPHRADASLAGLFVHFALSCSLAEAGRQNREIGVQTYSEHDCPKPNLTDSRNAALVNDRDTETSSAADATTTSTLEQTHTAGMMDNDRNEPVCCTMLHCARLALADGAKRDCVVAELRSLLKLNTKEVSLQTEPISLAVSTPVREKGAHAREIQLRRESGVREARIVLAWNLLGIRRWLRSQCLYLPSGRCSAACYDRSDARCTIHQGRSLHPARDMVRSASRNDYALQWLLAESKALMRFFAPLEMLIRLGRSANVASLSACWVRQLNKISLSTIRENLVELRDRIASTLAHVQESPDIDDRQLGSTKNHDENVPKGVSFSDRFQLRHNRARLAGQVYPAVCSVTQHGPTAASKTIIERAYDDSHENSHGSINDSYMWLSERSQALDVMPSAASLALADFESVSEAYDNAERERLQSATRYATGDTRNGTATDAEVLAGQLDDVVSDLRHLLHELVTDDALQQDALGLIRMLEDQANAEQQMELVALLQQIRAVVDSADAADGEISEALAKLRNSARKKCAPAMKKLLVSDFDFESTSDDSIDEEIASASHLDRSNLAIVDIPHHAAISFPDFSEVSTFSKAKSSEREQESTITPAQFSVCAHRKECETAKRETGGLRRRALAGAQNDISSSLTSGTSLAAVLSDERQKVVQLSRRLEECERALVCEQRQRNEALNRLQEFELAQQALSEKESREAQLSHQLEECRRTLQSKQISNSELTHRLSECRNELHALRSETLALKQAEVFSQNAQTSAETAANEIRQQLLANDATLEKCIESLNNVTARLQVCDHEKQNLDALLERAETELETALKGHRAEIFRLRETIREKDTDLERQRAITAELADKACEAREDSDNAEKMLAECREQLGKAKSEIALKTGGNSSEARLPRSTAGSYYFPTYERGDRARAESDSHTSEKIWDAEGRGNSIARKAQPAKSPEHTAHPENTPKMAKERSEDEHREVSEVCPIDDNDAGSERHSSSTVLPGCGAKSANVGIEKSQPGDNRPTSSIDDAQGAITPTDKTSAVKRRTKETTGKGTNEIHKRLSASTAKQRRTTSVLSAKYVRRAVAYARKTLQRAQKTIKVTKPAGTICDSPSTPLATTLCNSDSRKRKMKDGPEKRSESNSEAGDSFKRQRRLSAEESGPHLPASPSKDANVSVGDVLETAFEVLLPLVSAEKANDSTQRHTDEPATPEQLKLLRTGVRNLSRQEREDAKLLLLHIKKLVRAKLSGSVSQYANQIQQLRRAVRDEKDGEHDNESSHSLHSDWTVPLSFLIDDVDFEPHTLTRFFREKESILSSTQCCSDNENQSENR